MDWMFRTVRWMIWTIVCSILLVFHQKIVFWITIAIGDNDGHGSSSSSNKDNNIIKYENDDSNVSMMANNASDELPADLLPNDEIKHEIMEADLPIIAFENPDIAVARALYGNKRKKYLKKR